MASGAMPSEFLCSVNKSSTDCSRMGWHRSCIRKRRKSRTCFVGAGARDVGKNVRAHCKIPEEKISRLERVLADKSRFKDKTKNMVIAERIAKLLGYSYDLVYSKISELARMRAGLVHGMRAENEIGITEQEEFIESIQGVHCKYERKQLARTSPQQLLAIQVVPLWPLIRPATLTLLAKNVQTSK